MNKIFSKISSSWDDGDVLDLKLAKLLLKYNIPGTFFIPSNCKLPDEGIKWLSDNGFEIGGHTTTHPREFHLMSCNEQEQEISLNKEWLEELTSKKVKAFCYPRGRYNEDTLKILKDLDFEWARTTRVNNFKIPDNNLVVKTSIHVHPNRKEYNGRKWNEVGLELCNKAMGIENGMFHIWGHSWEISKFCLWEDLEKFFEKITK